MRKLLFFLPALLAGFPAWAGDTGTLQEAASLYQQPQQNVLASLPAGTLLEVTAREGGWYRVSLTDGRSGYVRLRQVRFQEEQDGDSVFGGLWSWLNSSRRSQDDMSSATAGIRGFDEKQLQEAQPDYEAVEGLLGFASGPEKARRFAGGLSLKQQSVDELPE